MWSITVLHQKLHSKQFDYMASDRWLRKREKTIHLLTNRIVHTTAFVTRCIALNGIKYTSMVPSRGTQHIMSEQFTNKWSHTDIFIHVQNGGNNNTFIDLST